MKLAVAFISLALLACAGMARASEYEDEICHYECSVAFCEPYDDYCDYDCFEVCSPYRQAALRDHSYAATKTPGGGFSDYPTKSGSQESGFKSSPVRHFNSRIVPSSARWNRNAEVANVLTGKVVKMRIQKRTATQGDGVTSKISPPKGIALFQSCLSGSS